MDEIHFKGSAMLKTKCMQRFKAAPFTMEAYGEKVDGCNYTFWPLGNLASKPGALPWALTHTQRQTTISLHSKQIFAAIFFTLI